MVFRREEKVAIAKKLDSLGIHRIEAGMPAVSAQDKAAISDIAALGLKAEIFGFALHPRRDRRDQGVRLLGRRHRDPGQRPHDRYGYGWPIERAMKASIETTLAAKAAGLYTVFFTIDATRTELNRFLDIVEQVATEGHMDALTIADTMGVCTPDAVSHVVKKVIDRTQEARSRFTVTRTSGSAWPTPWRRWRPAPQSRTRRSRASASARATCPSRTS